jgi:uncharacterized protein YoxC
MKATRKIALLFIVFVLFLLPLTVCASADDAVTEDAPAIVGDAPATDAVEDATEDLPTLFSRLGEAWENGDVKDVVVILGVLISNIYLTIVKRSGKTSADDVKANINAATQNITGKTNELVDSLNHLEEKANELFAKVELILPELSEAIANVKLADAESVAQLCKKADACGNAVVAFASMMQSIYANSKTIPQPVKDMVNASYVEVTKAFEEAQG